MAKKNSFAGVAVWFVLGILLGGAAIGGAFLWLTRDEPQALEPIVPKTPAASAPAAAPAPAAPPETAAAPVELTPEQRQIAEDAAATGLTQPPDPAGGR